MDLGAYVFVMRGQPLLALVLGFAVAVPLIFILVEPLGFWGVMLGVVAAGVVAYFVAPSARE